MAELYIAGVQNADDQPERDVLCCAHLPGSHAVIRLAVEMLTEAYKRDRAGILARLTATAPDLEEPIDVPEQLFDAAPENPRELFGQEQQPRADETR